MELERKNINRGYTKLRVWNDFIDLYKFVYFAIKDFPLELSKTRNNILDASNSISRNIAEGYCRRNLKEYLNFLNASLGSVGKLFTGMYSFREIKVLRESDFEIFDELHYKVENELDLFGNTKSHYEKNFE